MLEVREPGLLTTVQDGGRPGSTDLGVPVGGACDRWSLAVANLLLGNDPDAAALEMTLVGPELLVQDRCAVAIGGADLGARVAEEDRPMAPGTAHLVLPGTRIVFDRRRRDPSGARAYLAVAGGIDVEPVLGSRGTCLAGGFGGIDGRALRRGDRILPRRPRDVSGAGRRWPEGLEGPAWSGPLRLMTAPATLARPVPGAFAALLATTWRVGRDMDRMGIRLDGRALPVDGAAAGRLMSRGVLPGSIQVPPGGRPIVLLADAQTVGGYPVAGIVPAADLPHLAQLRPGEEFLFQATTVEAARTAALAARRALEAAARRLAATEDWNGIAEAMG